MQIGDTFQHKDVMLRIERQQSEFSCEGCAFSTKNEKEEVGCLATKDEYFAGYCMKCRIIFTSVSDSIKGTFIEKRKLLTLQK